MGLEWLDTSAAQIEAERLRFVLEGDSDRAGATELNPAQLLGLFLALLARQHGRDARELAQATRQPDAWLPAFLIDGWNTISFSRQHRPMNIRQVTGLIGRAEDAIQRIADPDRPICASRTCKRPVPIGRNAGAQFCREECRSQERQRAYRARQAA